MSQRLFAVRGAIQVEQDDPEHIIASVSELYKQICKENDLGEDMMVSLQFTITSDLQSMNPASALRSQCTQFVVPLFCMQEPTIHGMLDHTIRVLVHYYHKTEHKPKPVYLRGAQVLRRDIMKEE
jgi:chorismate mutase